MGAHLAQVRALISNQRCKFKSCNGCIWTWTWNGFGKVVGFRINGHGYHINHCNVHGNNNGQQYTQLSNNDNVIVCLWIHVNMNKVIFKPYDANDFNSCDNEMCKFLLCDKCQNFKVYHKCYKELIKIKNNKCQSYMIMNSGYVMNNFNSKWGGHYYRNQDIILM